MPLSHTYTSCISIVYADMHIYIHMYTYVHTTTPHNTYHLHKPFQVLYRGRSYLAQIEIILRGQKLSRPPHGRQIWNQRSNIFQILIYYSTPVQINVLLLQSFRVQYIEMPFPHIQEGVLWKKRHHLWKRKASLVKHKCHFHMYMCI